MLGQTTNTGLLNALLIGPCSLAAVGAFAAKHTDAHALDGHHPHTTDEVFLLIHILGVDALAVEHTHLIVQQVATVHLEEVALQLNTNVTTIGSVHAATVGETRQLADGLAI